MVSCFSQVNTTFEDFITVKTFQKTEQTIYVLKKKLFFKKKEWNEYVVQMIEVQDFVFLDEKTKFQRVE